MDPTKLVVIIENGEDEKQFEVPEHGLENGARLEWIPVSINLGTIKVDKDTKITIRNNDDQWPIAKAMRWFIDNIKVLDASSAGIDGIVADNEAPVEYFNLQGIRVAEPSNGLYIRRQGKEVTKVMVK